MAELFRLLAWDSMHLFHDWITPHQSPLILYCIAKATGGFPEMSYTKIDGLHRAQRDHIIIAPPACAVTQK
jgi:hypothetical protein